MSKTWESKLAMEYVSKAQKRFDDAIVCMDIAADHYLSAGMERKTIACANAYAILMSASKVMDTLARELDDEEDS